MSLVFYKLLCRVLKVALITVATSIFPSAANPYFLRAPSDVDVVFEHGQSSSQAILLECHISGKTHDHRVSWMKNGCLLSDDYEIREQCDPDQRHSILGDDDRVFNLYIFPVNTQHARSDSGNYTCIVFDRNTDSEIARSRTATVAIYITPRAEHPVCQAEGLNTSTVIKEYEKQVLHCFCDLGWPDTHLELRFIQERSSKIIEPTQTYVQNSCIHVEYDWYPTYRDTGAMFECRAIHPGFEVQGQPARKTNCTFGPYDNIHYTPKVTLKPPLQNITKGGGEIIFNCSATAKPDVHYMTLSIDGIPIMVSSNGDILIYQAANFPLDDTYSGRYNVTCIAENQLGEGRAVATLIIHYDAVISVGSSLATAFSTTFHLSLGLLIMTLVQF